MCNDRWNLPQERCLGIESNQKKKTKWRLWQSITSHRPRWRLFGVAVPTRSNWWGPVSQYWCWLSFFKWWCWKNGGESSRLLEFLWIRSKRKKRERLRPRWRGGLTRLSKIYLIDQIVVWKGCWFESRGWVGSSLRFLGRFEDFGRDFRLSEVFGLEN